MSDQPPQPPEPQRPPAYRPRFAGTYMTLSIILAVGAATTTAVSIHILAPQADLIVGVLFCMLGTAISLRFGFLIVHHHWPRYNAVTAYVNSALACMLVSTEILGIHFAAANLPSVLFALPVAIMSLIIARALDLSRR